MSLLTVFESAQQQLCALLGGFLIAVLITPIVRKVAIRFGLVDRPDPERKLHREPIALSGGVAVFLSLILSAGLATLASESVRTAVLKLPWHVIGLGIASTGIVLLGLVDDAIVIRGRQKLAGQVVLVAILVACGFRMETVSIFGWSTDLGLLVIPISMGWLLLTINALNLIDGADGLCSTVGWTASAGIAAMATIGSHSVEGAIAAGLCGSLLGFLVYNFPPAKIFLGDAGSMLIGLLLGALALRTNLAGATAISLLGTVAVLAIPIFDSSMAIIRRKFTGRSIFTVDRGHLHHNLLRAGWSSSGLVVLMTALCGITAIGAFLGIAFQNELVALISMATVLGSLVASRIFGFAEMKLVVNRAIHFGGSLFTRRKACPEAVVQQTVRLQGNRSWEIIWQSITEFAQKHGLARICLDLNMPWLHEGFHANWQKSRMPETVDRWTTTIPIVCAGRMLGRLELIGNTKSGNVFEILGQLAELLEDLQPQITKLSSMEAVVAAIENASENNDHNVFADESELEQIDEGMTLLASEQVARI